MSVWVLLIWVSGLAPIGGQNPEVWVFRSKEDCLAVAETQGAIHIAGVRVMPGRCVEEDIIEDTVTLPKMGAKP